MDPNWVTKCFAARDSVLEYTITATVSLLCAVTIDQLCKSGMDTIRSELSCDCQNQASWNTTMCFFNSYLCSISPSCWVNCSMKWGSRILSVLVLRFLVGFKLQHTLPLVAGFMLWKQLQVIWYHVVTFGLVCSIIYSMVVYRSHLTQSRVKRKPEHLKELLEDYLMECDHVKVGITLTMVILFGCFELVEEGFLFNMVMVGDSYELWCQSENDDCCRK